MLEQADGAPCQASLAPMLASGRLSASASMQMHKAGSNGIPASPCDTAALQVGLLDGPAALARVLMTPEALPHLQRAAVVDALANLLAAAAREPTAAVAELSPRGLLAILQLLACLTAPAETPTPRPAHSCLHTCSTSQPLLPLCAVCCL